MSNAARTRPPTGSAGGTASAGGAGSAGGTEPPDFATVLAERLARSRALGDDLEAQLAELGGLRDANNDDEHDPDGSPVSAEWSRLEGMRRENADEQAQIRAAIGRLERGEYGVCERCGTQIDLRRLAVRPMAATCVACAG